MVLCSGVECSEKCFVGRTVRGDSERQGELRGLKCSENILLEGERV